ncbi:MAG: Cys-tRNA(Pro) deacylase [Sphingobium sp.]|nr:Cys-tRNA(Pro) deacylase [Sphingobium sp.]
MSKAANTPATLQLSRAGKAFILHPYDYAAGDDHHKGVSAAHALGQAEESVFKTLMVEIDGRPACAIIPVAQSLSMKKVAAHFGAKTAVMMAPDKAERLTGYRVGGISPFGQKRACPTVLDAQAQGQAAIFINAGKRGLLLEIAPEDAASALQAEMVNICAD